MKILVIGKEHVEGTSKKTGKEFNFTNVYAIGKNPKGEGEKAVVVSVAHNLVPYDGILVNEEYIVDRDERGFVEDFYLAAPPAPAAAPAKA